MTHEAHGHQHDFSDVDRFAALFDDPERDEWQMPAEVVVRMELAEGMTAVDLGAGTGYFVPFLAEAVGARGRVLALDVQSEMVEHMRERFRDRAPGRFEARVVPTDDPELGAETVDRILIVNTWHHIAHREPFAAKLRAALRPGGVLVIVDFTEESPHGPPAEMRLAAEQVADELASAGFDAAIVDEPLPFQYIVRAR